MTQEFHISVTPLGNDQFLVRTERVAPGVLLAEEQATWPVEEWLLQARQLMNDPLLGLLQGYGSDRIGRFEPATPLDEPSDASLVDSPKSLVELGQQLYSALFQGTLRDSWVTAQGVAQNRGEALRLRLGLKGLQLPRLPWEVMHASDLGLTPRPLATGMDVVFSRYQPGIGLVGAGTLLTVEPGQPLRILMAIAAPTDQERLDLKQEVLHLQQELSTRNGNGPDGAESAPEIQLTILEQPGREQLTQELEQGNYQVLHYAGHSNLGAAGGSLYLVNNKTGLTEILSGDDLAGLLVNNGIRMVVFNSCQGAYIAASDPLAETERNLAEALVSRGIPAVLAMAEKIPDDVALTLTRLFYRNLKQGYPIDLSLGRARQGLISSYGSHQFYWALPILYLHPEFDGYLTAGDRTIENPLDRLLLSSPIYELLPGLIDDESPFTTASHLSSREQQDLELISKAVLEDDLAEDLMEEDLNYDPKLDGDEELSYDEDEAIVAGLMKQLVYPPQSDADHGLPAVDQEFLSAEEAIAILESHQDSLGGLVHHPPSYPATNGSVSNVSANGTVVSNLANRSTHPPTSTSDANATASTPPASIETTTLDDSTVSRKRLPQRFLLIAAGVGVVALLAGLFGLLMVSIWDRNRQTPAELLQEPTLLESPVSEGTEPPTESLPPPDADLTNTAISYFNRAATQFQQNNPDAAQDELAAGVEVVEELLDQNLVRFAETALQTATGAGIDNPAINFLGGRVAWQAVKTGEPAYYSIDDARRSWEVAVNGQPDSIEYRNGLGFALYEEGKIYIDEGDQARARETWILALDKLQAQSADCQNNPTACAVSALILMQLGELNPSQQAEFVNKARDLYEQVQSADPANFQSQALSTNWLWTEAAIQEWQSLAKVK